MKLMTFPTNAGEMKVKLPERAQIIGMAAPELVRNSAGAIRAALNHSIGSPGLAELVRRKICSKPDCTAVVVVSDNTRPVPYTGEQGILWPVIQTLLEAGIPKEHLLILVANGTHRALSETELRQMLDSRVFEMEIPVKNHDSRDKQGLVYLMKTSRGSEIYLNRDYRLADIKILTGLVESHFMAGVSGGRKSVCPGLIGEESTSVFHGTRFLSSSAACDLNLAGNPCHEEALEVALEAGADYIVNVTLDRNFQLTGVFAGDLIRAHEAATAKIRHDAAIPVDREFDIVVTHAGFVGINHYQAAKAAVAAIPVLKPGGTLIIAADNTDFDPVGSPNYRTLIHLLKLMGAERFDQLISSPDWTFISEQWQVQMWGRVFKKIMMKDFIYYSPQISARDYHVLPGRDGNDFLPVEKRYTGSPETISQAIEGALEHLGRSGKYLQTEYSVAFLSEGPYGIPVKVV